MFSLQLCFYLLFVVCVLNATIIIWHGYRRLDRVVF